MWLERFAGQSTQSSPAGGSPNRGFSPVPRRPTQQGAFAAPHRPGLTPRTSSLGALVGSDSTDSLPLIARTQNGSHLRRELSSIANANNDPLVTLSAILSTEIHDDTKQDDVHLSELIDFHSQSLQDFANEKPDDDIKQVEQQHGVDNFEKETDKFQDLHKSITACDQVLGEVETYLASFKADLAAVSTEIESLQHRSTSLNARLDNRKVVEKILGPEVDSFSISPAIVRKIVTGPIDDTWIRALDEFEKRSKAIDASFSEGKAARAAQDIRPIINDVSNKAVERIRDYVVSQIKALRSPHINAQIIQQNQFVKFRNGYAFLVQRQPQLGAEIEHAYVNTMRWYFLSNFTRYRAAIEKLKVHEIEATENIAADAPRRVAKAAPPHDAFQLGRRMEVLRAASGPLSSYVAEESKDFHYLEIPFRTFNLALVDNASAEYSFLTEFYHKQPLGTTTKRFGEIWQPTFELGQAFAKHLVEHNQDAIGVLICIRLNQKFAFELQRRKIPAAEGYTNSINMVLWPRFQLIIDAHCESVRKLTTSLPGKPTSPALTLTSTAVAARSTAPHALSQRLANFLHAILSLSHEAGDDEPVANSLVRLRNEYEAFLVKLSKEIAEVRKKARFLHNNYSLICTILADTEGRMADEMRGRFTELRDGIEITTQ